MSTMSSSQSLPYRGAVGRISRDARLQMRIDLGGPSSSSESKSSHEIPDHLPDWSNQKVIHRHTLPPRSHFFVYDSEKDALAADAGRARSALLSGKWGFHLSTGPFKGPREFYDPSFDNSAWDVVDVPGMWQLQGHGKGPHYTNVPYPFPVDPPNVPYDDNECGRYVTKFAVPGRLKDGEQWRLRFEGVDSAFAVWLNGEKIGYSQGSRNPSEFDVTKTLDLDSEENYLAVEVYQWNDGSYIEDQDQWWLSGIFRDVWLHSFTPERVEDFQIQTLLDADYKDACLDVSVQLNKANLPTTLKLFDEDGKIIFEQKCTSKSKSLRYKHQVKNPHKWTAETPYLYTLSISVGETHVAHRVGFRTAELLKGVFCVNGKPIKFRGVNRHEHHPDFGRAVPYNFLRRDLLQMKYFNINAIRTSHYPNDPRLYDLADELGFWVLDEADLECHGFIMTGGDASKFTSDNPEWEDAYVDRARQLVARDKNHACIIMWSLGNEAWYGRNHQAMYDEIKRMDQTRLVHYEGDWFAQTADVFSRMYSPVDEMIGYGEEEEWTKPFVMCEYIHAMGNGPGAIKEYIDTFYKYPRLMGGFVWEWANHGLRTKNAEGEEYMAYGGDFGDEPNDGNFVMDGLCFANHNPTPGLIEYSKAIEPVQVVGIHGMEIEIVNRYDILSLDHLRCRWDIISDRSQMIGKEIKIPTDIKPHTKARLILGNDVPKTFSSETWIQIEFYTREVTKWAYPGHVLSTTQFPLSPPKSLALLKSLSIPGRPKVQMSSDVIHVALLNGTTFGFDAVNGSLCALARAAKPHFNLITEPMTLDFYRALTDNDRGAWHGQQWKERLLHQTRHHFTKMSVTEDEKVCKIVIQGRVAPPVFAWAVDTTTTLIITSDHCSVHIKAKPHGLNLPETFARFGLSLGLKDVKYVEWFGRGYGESYADKKLSQHINTWGATVDGLFVDYEFPQDCGNRTDVRWVEFRENWGDAETGRLLRARFGDHDGASFSAMHYSTKDLDECRHPYELHKRKRKDTIVRLDWFHQGLGTGSCGPVALPKYELRTDREFDVELLLD